MDAIAEISTPRPAGVRLMSIQVIELVQYTKGLTLAEYGVLISLSSFADRDGMCWPSLETLADISNVEKKTAIRAIQRLSILEAMRGKHGPKLQPILGKVIYGTEDDPKDKDGMRTVDPERAPSTHFPLSRRLEAALVRLGWGDRVAGIAVIADHPSLRRKRPDDDEKYQQNQLRASDEILKRFTDAYREV